MRLSPLSSPIYRSATARSLSPFPAEVVEAVQRGDYLEAFHVLALEYGRLAAEIQPSKGARV